MRQLTAKLLSEFGRTVKLIPDAVGTYGAEATLAGDEEGVITCRAVFSRPKEKKPPEGDLGALRVADVQGGESGDWLCTISAAVFTTPPTEDWRLVDGASTYAIVKATPVYWADAVVNYLLLLRLI